MSNSKTDNEFSSAVLVLADGTFFQGKAFGKLEKEIAGELVFSTSMTGYVELLTDPSYYQQILTLTYPEIGNYGVTKNDMESLRIHAQGLVIRELSPAVSNWRSMLPLNEWLEEEGIPGILGIDTRALVHHLRTQGSQMAILSTKKQFDVLDLYHQVQKMPGMQGRQLASEASTRTIYEYNKNLADLDGKEILPTAFSRYHVAVIDFGVKHNMLKMLVYRGCKVTVFPAWASVTEIMSHSPDGLFLTNGPGDPETMLVPIETVKQLIGVLPIFGICMGHQILSLALGASTYKLKFGHRGANQPVMGNDKRVMITSQNHGFAVKDEGSITIFDKNLINLSDGTVEGICLEDKWVFSVQYHPEAAPGPHDGQIHFDQFITMMENWKKTRERKVLSQEVLT